MNEATVGLSELKTHLNEYVQRVKKGEKIAITERGKPVGWLVPVEPTQAQKVQTMLETGAATWSGKKLRPYQPAVSNTSNTLLSDIVSDQRE